MLTLYDFHASGNGFKVRLFLNLLRRPFNYVEVDILKGESRTAEFMLRNPNGRIPVLEIAPHEFLFESNAILFWLAAGTRYLPEDSLERARVLQWMFFEQYSHEPNIATSRFIRMHKTLDANAEAVLAQKKVLGDTALYVMEDHLRERDYFVGHRLSIADLALYAYTHVADEGGFDLRGFAAIRRWLERIASLPDYVPITNAHGLAETSVG